MDYYPFIPYLQSVYIMQICNTTYSVLVNYVIMGKKKSVKKRVSRCIIRFFRGVHVLVRQLF